MGIKQVHYKNETSITMKRLLTLSLMIFSVQCSATLNAADTGYYQDFSTRTGAFSAVGGGGVPGDISDAISERCQLLWSTIWPTAISAESDCDGQ